jgi:hypothetical protein
VVAWGQCGGLQLPNVSSPWSCICKVSDLILTDANDITGSVRIMTTIRHKMSVEPTPDTCLTSNMSATVGSVQRSALSCENEATGCPINQLTEREERRTVSVNWLSGHFFCMPLSYQLLNSKQSHALCSKNERSLLVTKGLTMIPGNLLRLRWWAVSFTLRKLCPQ